MRHLPSAADRRTDFPAWYYCLAIFAGTVLFRLICLHYFLDSPFFVPLGGDRALYHNLALAVFRNEWFTNVFSFLPLYPAALGFFYTLIGGANLAAIAIFQACLDGVTAVLATLITFQYYGKRSALVAGLLYMLLGTAVVYSLVTMPVTLGLFWTALTLFLCVRWQDDWNYWRAIMMGLILGGGGQIMGWFWLMVVPLAVWIAISGGPCTVSYRKNNFILFVTVMFCAAVPSRARPLRPCPLTDPCERISRTRFFSSRFCSGMVHPPLIINGLGNGLLAIM